MKQAKYNPNFILRYSMKGHKETITSIKFSKNGKWLASASADKTIILWDANNGQYLSTLEGHCGEVYDIEFSNDSYLLVSVSIDSTIRLWGLPSAKPLKKIVPETTKPFTCCTFNARGDCILVGTYEGEIYVYDVQSGNIISGYDRHRLPVCGLSMDSGNNVLSSGMEGKCFLWHSGSGTTISAINNASAVKISHSALFPTDEYFAVSYANNRIYLYDAKNGHNLQRYSGGHKCQHAGFKIKVAFYCTGERRLVVTGSEDFCVYLYDMETAEVVQKLEGHADVVTNVICHPKEQIIASSSKDNSIFLWKRKE